MREYSLFSSRRVARLSLPLLWVGLAAAQDPEAAGPASPPALEELSESPASEDLPAVPQAAPTDAALQNRTTLNLLGAADTAAGESRRNENRNIALVDNNAAQELNQRVGTTATIIDEFQPAQGYYSAEYGGAIRRPIHVPAQSGRGIHGNFFWDHDNSLLRARSFFQVGGVRPARSNQYGGTVGLDAWRGAFLSLSGSQTKIRGNVNGNVLIPLPEEHTPLTDDPVLRPLVQRLLDAYPNVKPNRPDIAERALNANSLQSINTDTSTGQLTQRIRDRDTLSFQYAFTAQRVDAFQFIVGQNPDTTNQSHRARITWNRAWSPRTITDVSAGFDRQNTRLLAAEGAVGPIFSQGITFLGPNNLIPLWRVQNRFRSSLAVRQQRGSHSWSAGVSGARLQYNGDEPDGSRPIFQFAPDFGRDGITNLRMGTPNRFIVAIGDTYRAFRNWDVQAYLGDKWTISQRLALTYGVQWEPITRPAEAAGKSDLPFDSDWNNVGGSFGFAYRLPRNLGVVRGAYGLMYGQIFPPTYGQERLNLPYNTRIQVLTPNFANPLEGIDLSKALDPDARSFHYAINPDLATPYSHQYNFAWEGEIGSGWSVELGYVGSRSIKLFSVYVLNRAEPVQGVPHTTATINLRRRDQSLYDLVDVNNGSRSYYDAGRVTLIAPRWQGLSLTGSYWFSKAIDLGFDYTATASGNAAFQGGGQTAYGVHDDLRGLSDFDQPHAFLLQTAYDTGPGTGGNGWLESMYRNWTISTVVLLKTGTPFTVQTGSDGMGVGNVDGIQSDRPMLLDASILGRTIGHPDTAPALLPRSAFRYIHAPQEMRGNVGRNTFRKGKLANVNASISRTWTLPREWRMTLRAESVNLFNTPQFDVPGNALTSPSFGQITNTLNDGRTFEFSLRLAF
jgi:hypothetical protein